MMIEMWWKKNSERVLLVSAVLLAVFLVFWFGYPSPDHGTWPDHPDRAIWMDAAWRVTQGQIPHTDFISPIGAAWLYFNALPIWLFGPSYNLSMTAGVAIWLVVFIIVFLGLFRFSGHRLLTWPIVFYIFVNFFISPFLDYNALAYLMIAWIIAESFTVREKMAEKLGLITGFFLATLLFWKVNFALLAIGFVVLGGLLVWKSKRWFIYLLVSFLVTVIWWLFSIRWQIGAMWSDYHLPLLIKNDSIKTVLFTWRNHGSIFRQQWVWLVIGEIFLLSAWKYNRWRFAWMSWRYWSLVIVVMLFFSQNLLILTNANQPNVYIFSWLMLLSLLWLAQGIKNDYNHVRVWFVAGILIFSLHLVIGFGPVVKERAKLRMIRQQTVLESDTSNYAGSLLDGIQLLERNGLNEKRVLNLDFSNPFPSLLKSASVKGDLLWWNHLDSFNKEIHPNIPTILDHADVVMEPLWYADSFRRDVALRKKELFAPSLSSSYYELTSDRYWRLWVKK